MTTSASTLPIVAIVGRPNVGKSTLFNRIVGQPVAIVGDVPGITRDRLYAEAEWGVHRFTLVDTGGLESQAVSDMAERVREQAQTAILEADAIIFVADVVDGATSTDLEIAEMLRRSGKPVVLAVNKADNQQRRLDAVVFYELGLGDPVPVSAYHGQGTGELLDQVVQHLSLPAPAALVPEMLRIAIVGRPNVGKSRLLNAILGEERVIVSDVPGTTRDAIDTVVERDGQRHLLIDTAGIRRRGRIDVGLERYSVLRALRAVNRAEVVLLLVDATEPMAAQDVHIAGFVREAYKGIVVVVNKWDLVEKGPETTAEFTALIRQQLNFMPYVPILFISAKFGQRVDQVLSTARRVYEERTKRVQTAALNRLIEDAVATHSPPSERGRRLRIYYVTQADVNPPTFVFFVNDPQIMHFSYERYLENRLRDVFGFEGNPVRMIFRARGEEGESS